MKRRASLHPGQWVGPYVVDRVLGAGGMGAVYAGRRRADGRPVALKTIHESLARDSHIRARFLREGRAVARLRHPNVVRVLDVSADEIRPYVVMELLEGEDLATLLARRGPLTGADACALLAPVARGVAHAHSRGVIHRDLKPDNVFLARGPQGELVPKVLDFGVSKVAGDVSVTADATLLGTPYYMSPEHVEGAGHVGPASDQFSLGVMLYEAVTGRVPFRERGLYPLLSAIALCEPEPPSACAPGLDRELEAVILRALARDPQGRFPSMDALARCLAERAEGARCVRPPPRGSWRRALERAETLAMGAPPRVEPWHEPAPGFPCVAPA